MRLVNLILSLGLTYFSGDSLQTKADGPIFNNRAFIPYILKWSPLDVDRNGIYDHIAVQYDLDHNEKGDGYATFLIIQTLIGKGDTQYVASSIADYLARDIDEDGFMDEIMWDSDKNFTLDKHELIDNSKRKK